MVEQHHKIQVLLQEYEGLRTEIIHRTNNLHQVIAIGAVVFGLALMAANFHRIAVDFVVTAGGLIFVLGLLGIRRDIQKAAKRLREIEDDVNVRAGETLLVWETYFGGEQTGHFGRGQELPRPSASAIQS